MRVNVVIITLTWSLTLWYQPGPTGTHMSCKHHCIIHRIPITITTSSLVTSHCTIGIKRDATSFNIIHAWYITSLTFFAMAYKYILLLFLVLLFKAFVVLSIFLIHNWLGLTFMSSLPNLFVVLIDWFLSFMCSRRSTTSLDSSGLAFFIFQPFHLLTPYFFLPQKFFFDKIEFSTY